MFKKSLVLFTIIAVSMFSGCQSKTPKSPSPAKPQSYQKPGGPILPSLPGGTTANKVPPKQIDSIRSNINSIMIDLDKKNWSKAKSRASSIRADISQLKTSLRTLGITTGTSGKTTGTPGTALGTPGTIMGNAGTAAKKPGNIIGNVGNTIKNPGSIIGNPGTTTKTPGTIMGIPGTTARNADATNRIISLMTKASTDLDKSISAKKVYDAKVNANQISKNLADVSQSYTGTSPAELDRLEYLCRQISLDAEKRDWTVARSNLSTCKATLGTLKTKLNGKNKTEFARIDNTLAKLSKSLSTKNTKETVKYASACLNNVQAIRKVPLKTR
jgi:hypothetical protein